MLILSIGIILSLYSTLLYIIEFIPPKQSIINPNTVAFFFIILFYNLYLYQNAFSYFKMGYASAMAWILLLIALAIILVLFKVFRFGESDY